MLDGLDEIDWGRLSHAYGVASDVPDLIRALASTDEEGRREAISALFGNIWHQGTVYEATGFAVPFLVELVDEPSVSGKSYILGLLHEIASGSSYLDVHQDLDWYRKERETPEFAAQLTQELEWARRAGDAVSAGHPVYARLLEDDDPQTKAWAAYALSTCVGFLREIEPTLWKHVETERDATARACSLLCLRDLWRHAFSASTISAPEADERLRYASRVMHSATESPPTRLAAALAILELAEGAERAEALSMLRELVAASWKAYTRLPWAQAGDDLLSSIGTALRTHADDYQSFLFSLLDNPDSDICTSAIWAVRQLCQRRRSVSRLERFPIESRGWVVVGYDDASSIFTRPAPKGR